MKREVDNKTILDKFAEDFTKIVEKHCDKRAINMETAKLVKAGLPQPLVERFLKEILEERDC